MLYLVTDQRNLTEEQFLHIVQEAIKGGVKMVQLREKEASARTLMGLGKKLLAILRPQNIPLIINDRVDVAHALQADGVHLGQSDLPVAEARTILGPKALIGLSVETLEQNWEGADYLAASPIFATATKRDHAPPWGLDGLRQLCTVSQKPVFAIGGINETNIGEVRSAGAAGVAVVSAIFQAPCPQTAARRLIHAFS